MTDSKPTSSAEDRQQQQKSTDNYKEVYASVVPLTQILRMFCYSLKVDDVGVALVQW